MQKHDIVDTLYHALCISCQNSTKQTSIPNILESETLDNTHTTINKQCEIDELQTSLDIIVFD